MPKPAKPEATAPTVPADKKGRDRSPNFPSLDLKKAIELAEMVYKSESKNSARAPVITQHWGYGDKSSGGKRALAALNAYGLMVFSGEGDKREGRLSDAALRIILNTPERDEEIQKAALRPRIHSELWTKYEDAGLPSDANLTSHLIMEKDFNKDVVSGFIKQFRATLAFANLTEGDTIGGDDDEGDDMEAVKETKRSLDDLQAAKRAVDAKRALLNATDLPLPVPLPDGTIRVVPIPRMTPEVFDFFKKQLEAYRDTITKSPADQA